MSLKSRAVGLEGIDGATRSVILDSDFDAPGRDGGARESDLDVQRLRGGVAAGIRRIGDDHDLIGIRARRIRAGTGRRVTGVVDDLIRAGRAGDAHIDMTGRTAAVGRARDVRLIPLDHDGDEFARHERGDGDR